MPTNPLLKAVKGGKEKSPLDPQECCDWANDRLNEDIANLGLRWVVTGNKERPIALTQYQALSSTGGR